MLDLKINSMEKEFVPIDESQELKELGFKEPVCGYYHKLGDKKQTVLNVAWINMNSNIKPSSSDYYISAPLYQQAFRWFRDVHNIDGWIVPFHSLDGKEWCYIIETESIEDNLGTDDDYDTYEEAEIACIRVLIEIVKKKKANEKTQL